MAWRSKMHDPGQHRSGRSAPRPDGRRSACPSRPCSTPRRAPASSSSARTCQRRPNALHQRAPNARIDGFTITGGDHGGGIIVNGYAHYLEITNNRDQSATTGSTAAASGSATRTSRSTRRAVQPSTTSTPTTTTPTSTTTRSPRTAATDGAGGGISLCTGSTNYKVLRQLDLRQLHRWVTAAASPPRPVEQRPDRQQHHHLQPVVQPGHARPTAAASDRRRAGAGRQRPVARLRLGGHQREPDPGQPGRRRRRRRHPRPVRQRPGRGRAAAAELPGALVLA